MARAIAAARMTPRASRPLRRFVSFAIGIALEILVPFSVQVPDRAVAADARDRLGPAASVDLIDHGLMALPAARLRHRAVPGLDADRLVELPRGERERVVIAVRGLRRVLREESRRRVAVVADRRLAVARACPGVVLLAHDT